MEKTGPGGGYGGAETIMFRKLGGFRNLLAWQRADELSTAIYSLTSSFSSGSFRLRDQMRGAAISVPANIAEGYGRESLADYTRFCEIARGSLAELGTYLQHCERCGLVQGERLESAARLYSGASYLLNQLLRGLWEKQGKADWRRSTLEEPAPYTAEATPSCPSDEGSP